MLFACIGMSCVAIKMQRVRKERAAAAAIDRLGGEVSWSSDNSPEESGGRDWLRSLLGDGFFTHPDSVLIDSEAALEYLADLTHVPRLSLHGNQITDAGLEHVKGLTRLEQLYIRDTRVSDSGLEHLKGLTQLEDLILFRTQISDNGVRILQQALPHCDVHQIENVECFP